MAEIVDYTHCFEESLLVQGQGSNVLMLSRTRQPMRRVDGKLASFELVYRWLSTDCHSEDDQAWACVLGAEITYWQEKEIRPLLSQIKKGKQANLFDRFKLFG